MYLLCSLDANAISMKRIFKDSGTCIELGILSWSDTPPPTQTDVFKTRVKGSMVEQKQ
jgi:hypothetical protein